MTYSFTCPLSGCGMVMTATGKDRQEAAKSLIGQAKVHLTNVHPEIKKSDEEVSADIHAHMVAL